MGTNYYYVVQTAKKMGPMIHIGKATYSATFNEFIWAMDPIKLAMHISSIADPVVIRDEYNHIIGLAKFMTFVSECHQDYSQINKVVS